MDLKKYMDTLKGSMDPMLVKVSMLKIYPGFGRSCALNRVLAYDVSSVSRVANLH